MRLQPKLKCGVSDSQQISGADAFTLKIRADLLLVCRLTITRWLPNVTCQANTSEQDTPHSGVLLAPINNLKRSVCSLTIKSQQARKAV